MCGASLTLLTPASVRLYTARLRTSAGCVTGSWQWTPQEGLRDEGTGLLHTHTLPHLSSHGGISRSAASVGEWVAD